MTQYRKDPNAISNHFDELFEGIGHRGSSFTDIDGLAHDFHLTHDGATRRFLLIEFKRKRESLNVGQERVLIDFAKLPGCASIVIWWEGKDSYRFILYPDKIEDSVSGRTLRSIYKSWWDQCKVIEQPANTNAIDPLAIFDSQPKTNGATK